MENIYYVIYRMRSGEEFVQKTKRALSNIENIISEIRSEYSTNVTIENINGVTINFLTSDLYTICCLNPQQYEAHKQQEEMIKAIQMANASGLTYTEYAKRMEDLEKLKKGETEENSYFGEV